MPTRRLPWSLPRSAPFAVTSTVVVGVGALTASSLRAAAHVRDMRARGREVPPLDHDLELAGEAPLRRIAVVGDSAAAGHGLPDAEDAWARQIARALHATDGRATELRNAAVDGADIPCVLATQVHVLEDAEVVLINVGVNDAIRRHGPRRIARDLDRLLTEVHRRADPEVYVLLLTAPDLSVAPGLPAILAPPLALLCRMTARVQRRVAAAHGVDTIAMPRQVLPPEVFGDDGFHPGVIGHRRMAAALIERLTAPH